MTDPADTFEIAVRYDDDLREQVKEGATDPLGWIDVIRGGDKPLVGGEHEEGMREYLTSLFGGLLQALMGCVAGNDEILRTGNGPLYIVFEPADDEAISVSICYSKRSAHSPAQREAYEPSVTVRAEPLVNELVDRATEFEAFVADVNPQLAADSPDYRGLREDIDRLRDVYRSDRSR